MAAPVPPDLPTPAKPSESWLGCYLRLLLVPISLSFLCSDWTSLGDTHDILVVCLAIFLVPSFACWALIRAIASSVEWWSYLSARRQAWKQALKQAREGGQVSGDEVSEDLQSC